jgi:membrane peptidoglycan carboxypeptidase
MEAGFSPQDSIVDEPLVMNIPGSGRWSPENYGRKFRGTVTLEEALAFSINTVAVRLSEKAGRQRVRALATAMGLTSPIAEGPAIALGVSEATLVEMTGAYAVIANGGRLAPPRGISEITIRGDETPVMTASETATGAQIISEASAAELTSMMEAVIRYGTGMRANPGRPAAGKTGTTQGARDAWFIGFTADFVIGVWMGKDDNAPLTGVTGGGLPAAIWREVALRIHEGLPARPLNTSAGRSGGGLIAGTGVNTDDGVVTSVFKEVFDFLSTDGGGGSGGSSAPRQDRIDR